MTISAVADTHAILWYLYDDSRLLDTAKSTMEAIEADGNQIAITSITLAEIVYLSEKGRIHELAFDRVIELIEPPSSSLVEVPFDSAVAQTMRTIPREQVPELPDRMIAATAYHLDVPVISRDHKIKSSIVTTIWEAEPAYTADGNETNANDDSSKKADDAS